MKNYKNKAITICAIILVFIYLFTITLAYRKYQIIRNDDPLAMFRSLFPVPYVIIILFSILCFIPVIVEIENKYINILLLIQLSLMIWFTPYCLSGFARITDSLWHVGIAKNLLEIEPETMFSWYYKDYPISYIFNYVVLKVLGFNAMMYARLIYPFFCAVIIVFLWYMFLSRLFTYKIAYISTLIAIYGISPELHVSPHSFGTILLLVSLILILTFKSRKSKILGFISTLLLVFTHPISPIILLFFIGAPLIINFLYYHANLPRKNYWILALLISMWSSCAFVYSTGGTGKTIAESIYNILYVKSSIQGLKFYLSTRTSSEFSQFSLINRVVSYSYLIAPLILFYRSILPLNLQKGLKKFILKIGKRNTYQELLMLSIGFQCGLLSIISVIGNVGVTENAYYLWERAFSYLRLTTSAYIGSTIIVKPIMVGARARAQIFPPSRKVWTATKILLLIWLLFLTFTYLPVRVERESYQIYPQSEGSGMIFLKSRFNLSEKTLSMFLQKQYASFMEPNSQFKCHDTAYHIYFLSKIPLTDKPPLPDTIVFRKTEYFYISYIYDKDFKNNRYVAAIIYLENFNDFNKIYSNPTFKIFIKRNVILE